MQQERYMRRAMELAEFGRGWTKTNPVVGAVLVKEDRIIGEGYHKNLADFTQSGKRWRIAGAGERIRQEQIFM